MDIRWASVSRSVVSHHIFISNTLADVLELPVTYLSCTRQSHQSRHRSGL